MKKYFALGSFSFPFLLIVWDESFEYLQTIK